MRPELCCDYMIFMCLFVVVVHTAEDMMVLRRANTQNHHLLENIRRKLITDNEEYDSVKEIQEPAPIGRINFQGADDEAFINDHGLRTKDVGQLSDKEHKKENEERIITGHGKGSMEKEARFLEGLKKDYNDEAHGGKDFTTVRENKKYDEAERIIHGHGLETKNPEEARLFNGLEKNRKKKEGKRRFYGSERDSKEIEDQRATNVHFDFKQPEEARLPDDNKKYSKKTKEIMIITGHGFGSKELEETRVQIRPQKSFEKVEKVRPSDFDEEKRHLNEDIVAIGGPGRGNINTFLKGTKTKYADNISHRDNPDKSSKENTEPFSKKTEPKFKGVDLQEDSNSASPVFVANFYPVNIDVKSDLLSRRVNAGSKNAMNEASEEGVTFKEDMLPLIKMDSLPH